MKMNKAEKIKGHYTGKSAVLVGNGINLLADDISWKTLLNNIRDHFGVNVVIERSKSFPLIFEELLFRLEGGRFTENLRQLKEFVAQQYMPIRNLEWHNRLMALACEEFMTTNYDYSLERVYDADFIRRNGNSQEYKYSLYRKNSIAGKNIWHIHGELDHGINREEGPSGSIMIGNEHYGDYHRKIHELIKPTENEALEAFDPGNPSWVSMFFTHDLHIVGLGLDYTETHLWWLINYRARMIREIGQLPNAIYYYYAQFDGRNDNDRDHKLQLLEALEVNVVPVSILEGMGDDRYRRYWDLLLDRELPLRMR